VVSVSRSASLAARSLGIPSFALCDYEHVNLSVFRLAGTYVIHPDVISAEAFRARGVSPKRLIPFHGIKEDVTFADVDLAPIPPHTFPELGGSRELRVLVRPPAEESHYHRAESSELGRLTLGWLAGENVRVVFSPRYEWQVAQLEQFEWAVQPLVLRDPVPSISLLKAVDVVVSGGGTMTREAAYLGIPAVSVFRGVGGDVDRYLEAAGRLTIVRSAEELVALDLRALERGEPMFTNRSAPDDIAGAVFHAIGRKAILSNSRA
jgi:predicted glycosyltransferase